MVGAIFYLSLLAFYFLGANLWHFNGNASGLGVFGQGAVQRWLVLPLMASALLLTLLFPIMSAETFGLNLLLSFAASLILLLVLALTITLAGGVPLRYLRTHHRTSQYRTVSEFWRGPKCSSHLKFLVALLGMFVVCIFAAAVGAAWIVESIIIIAKLWSVAGAYWWRAALVFGPTLILGGPLITMLLVLGLLGRILGEARREWLLRLVVLIVAWIGLYIVLCIMSFGFYHLVYRVVRAIGSSGLGTWLRENSWKIVSAVVGWMVATYAGARAGESSKSSGAKFGGVEFLARVGPYVFIARCCCRCQRWLR